MVPGSPLLPAQAMRRLAEFLEESGSRRTPSDVAAEAIDDWIARKRGQLPDVTVASPNGYRWKSLFLPEGSRLRMHWGGESFDALVQGSELMFKGAAVSPRQMTLDVAGTGYNAWRALWVLLPGAARWKQACRLRDEANRHGAPQALPPHEAMAAAAACMSETLRSALALVDHSARETQPPLERRQERKRRESDYLEYAFMKD